MKPAARAVLAGLLLAAAPAVPADMIPMRDYNLLSRGMTEAEVLFRVGRYDHQSSYGDYHHNIIRKTWYYIPEKKGSQSWISEIEFDGNGVVQELRRYRVRN